MYIDVVCKILGREIGSVVGMMDFFRTMDKFRGFWIGRAAGLPVSGIFKRRGARGAVELAGGMNKTPFLSSCNVGSYVFA